MRLDEPPRSSYDERVAALQTAVVAACRGAAGVPAPSFSVDGGVTVYDDGGRSARLQPLGQRTRVSLTAEDGLGAEAEVDADTLVSAISAHRSAYGAIVAALGVENGGRTAPR